MNADSDFLPHVRTGASQESTLPHDPLLDAVIAAAREAAVRIMAVYATAFAVRGKLDGSPVTAADEAAEAVILEALARHGEGRPIVSEEAAERGPLPEPGERFWLVDPLDGTREFVERNGEFTVNIALVDQRAPVLGVVLAPALGRLYAGRRRPDGGFEAFVEAAGVRRALRCRAAPAEGLTVVSSRAHGDEAALEAHLAGRRVAARVKAGSSLKLCLIADGEADLYPRFGRTMEWDIAAGHAVLRAAGGEVRTLDGAPLRYGKPRFENPHFIASGVEPAARAALPGVPPP